MVFSIAKKARAVKKGKCFALGDEDGIKKLKLTCIVYVSSHQGKAKKESMMSGGR